MIYIIISNIGLAIMMVIIYFRYSHFRITSNFKIRDLEKRLNHEITEKESISSSLTAEVRSEVEQVKQLLKTVDTMRKEKESESRLRLEAEKQIELALQKAQAIEKRMDDWKKIQDAAMLDAKGTIAKVGTEFLEKLAKDHKQEAEEQHIAIDKTFKNVYEYLEKISKNVESFKLANANVSQVVDKMTTDSESSEAHKHEAAIDPATKQAIDNVVANVKLSGHVANKVYIAASTVDGEKAKFLLCDLAFLKNDILHVFDFKSMRYFQEYIKTSDKTRAAEALKKRLDKYLSYISNPKYVAAVSKLAMSLKIKSSTQKVVLVISSRNEMKILKDIHYLEKIQNAKIDIFDVDSVNDLIL